MTEQWVNAEIPRDRWQRPLVLPPGAKANAKRVPYQRCTRFVGALDDTYNLQQWMRRQVVLGMGQRSDLVLAAAAADPLNKKLLNSIADQAHEAAKGSAAATKGTALHSLTERIDRGLELGVVPDEFKADLEAYKRATDGIEWTAIETFRVHDKFQVAGTADRIGMIHGRPMIADLKTGSIDYPHKMAMQLAMYAHSETYDIATDKRVEDPDRIDPSYGVIIHLPAGEGRCELHKIDIGVGWGACLLAKQVWDWRGRKGITEPLRAAAEPATWESLARNATDLERLREIWKRAAELGQLDEELKALIMARRTELAA